MAGTKAPDEGSAHSQGQGGGLKCGVEPILTAITTAIRRGPGIGQGLIIFPSLTPLLIIKSGAKKMIKDDKLEKGLISGLILFGWGFPG